ncbi:unnamed protein product [Blepharisma stoltei]|uniref:B box-type domain-containing protein n=1 Tax=Blepharisma stoltei TaxID=1481888 RepID=A0AAU9KAK0_9CILI|nr:unnamed protein product [Blepharisma stoltei]
MDSENFGFCRNHQNELAISYCRTSKEFICDTCKNHSSKEDHLIRADSKEFKHLRYQLVELFYNEYKNQLPPERLEQCILYKRLSKQTQAEIFTDLLEFDKIIPNTSDGLPVTFIDIQTGAWYSDDPQRTIGGLEAVKDNRMDLNRKLILKIKEYIRESKDDDLFVKRLRNDKNSIYDLSLRKLMQYLKDLWSIRTNQVRLFSPNTCEKCDSETERIRIPCLKKHLICQRCLENSKINSRYYCPIDFDTFPDTSIRYFWEKIPKCLGCNTQFNLTLQSPKILPCLNTLCLNCVSDAGFSTSNCRFCTQLHPESYFKQSRLITDFILFHQIRCYKHPKITDITIKSDSMKPMCIDCKKEPENEGAVFFNENIAEILRIFILERKESNHRSVFNDVKHWRYSNQQMIDLIYWLLNGNIINFRPILRGVSVCYNDNIENGNTVLTRFHSLMPPLISHDENSIYSPWKINAILDQVEVLTFRTSTPGVAITGFGISAPLKDARNACIRYIAIEKGEVAKMIPYNNLINNVNFTGEKIVEDFYFEDFPIDKDDWYTIQVKIEAEEVFRGSPLDGPLINIGSDGTSFEFSSKVLASHKSMNISYQNYLHGPIIKIYYNR